MAVLLAVTRLWSRAGVCWFGSASDGPNAGGFHFWPVWVSQQGFGFWNWSSVGWCVCVCVCVSHLSSSSSAELALKRPVSSVCEVCVFHGERPNERLSVDSASSIQRSLPTQMLHSSFTVIITGDYSHRECLGFTADLE